VPSDSAESPEKSKGQTKLQKKIEKLTTDQLKLIVRLHEMGYGTRRIARKVGISRKVARTILAKLGYLKPATNKSRATARGTAGKLDAFRDQIKAKVGQNLTTTRILREIRAQGYTGGRTILAEYVRTLRIKPPPKKKVWRRFETRPGQETQFDWSPYRLKIGGRERVVHAFGATLGFSRLSHVRFYPRENLSTLLEAHTHVFEYCQGVCHRHVYDRMATVALGTIGRDKKPLWHPRFLEFAAYYGFEPYLCKVADPDRKGKDERLFWYLERDFLRGSEFDSFDDLNRKVRLWLDEVANSRVHGTTRKIPKEAWQQERPFLIELPESRFPAYDEELRKVGPDSVISVRGTPYTIPAQLAHQTVCVHLFSDHFEVCDHKGQVVFSRRYVPDALRGQLVIDPMHYELVQRRSPLPGGSVAQLEDAFLKRFPELEQLCDGIKRRMKNLAHIHLRSMWRLAGQYGDEAFRKAAGRAQHYRRFDAHAVRRILERHYPLLDPAPEPEVPLTAAARVLVQLGDVDGGSLDDYAQLDSVDADDAMTQSPKADVDESDGKTTKTENEEDTDGTSQT
jgi:transposase